MSRNLASLDAENVPRGGAEGQETSETSNISVATKYDVPPATRIHRFRFLASSELRRLRLLIMARRCRANFGAVVSSRHHDIAALVTRSGGIA